MGNENKNINKKIAEKNTEIIELLEQIKNALYPAHGMTWDHVGNTHHVLESLKEITEFFCQPENK